MKRFQRTMNKKIKQLVDSKFVADGKYFCPMHPTRQTDDVNARCPICKMKLDSKEMYNKKMMDEHTALEEKYHGKKDLIHFEVNLSVIKSDECPSIIESALSKDPGVMDYSFDILNSVVHMYIDKTKTSKSNVEKLISDAGFDANNIKANPEAMAKLPDDCK
jgi:periplasmic mercuric ion binding protein